MFRVKACADKGLRILSLTGSGPSREYRKIVPKPSQYNIFPYSLIRTSR